MNMRKMLVMVLLTAASVLSAQTPSERYEHKYDMLVSQFGVDGVGVETVLNNWAKVDSTNVKLLMARFEYYFAKSKSEKVVQKDTRRYLGMEPLLTLKDSLGRDTYWFQETFYDDELYGLSVKAIDKAISLFPDRLDFRFVKANALIAYEKESPDMAMSYLKSLVAEAARRRADWDYTDGKVGRDFVSDSMQEYCYSFYSIGSPQARTAFFELSTVLAEVFPDNVQYINNIGSYYLLQHEYKTALKYYSKVLKKVPDDYTAIKNSAIAARRMNNTKLEKKFLQMLEK